MVFSTTQSIRQTEHNYGIDLLRLVSMFLVVSLHVLGASGVLGVKEGCKYHIGWFLEAIVVCAVDCFAIISGYVSYREKEKPYRYSKFFGFWLQVFTYSFGMTLVIFLLRPGIVSVKGLVQSLFPITTCAYWYASAYIGLLFVIPWLNKLLRSCTSKEATRLVAVLLVVFSGYVTFSNHFGDSFTLQNGYSFVWLAILYIVGAWLKKCEIPNRIPSKVFYLGSIACVLFSWIFFELIGGIFYNYTSFTIVFVAISLVCIFSKLRVRPAFAKGIAFFAPAAFGVYLIHLTPAFYNHFFVPAFTWIADFSAWLIPLLVIGCALGIFIVCLFIEKARLLLFRVLQINRFIAFVEGKIDIAVNKFSDKITSKIEP